jgi:hypothetical protein
MKRSTRSTRVLRSWRCSGKTRAPAGGPARRRARAAASELRGVFAKRRADVGLAARRYRTAMSAPHPRFTFRIHPERLAIARLEREAAVPDWARGQFVNVARTPTELSIVCAQEHVPRSVVHEREKIAFGIVGTVPMTSIGILASLCGALARASVPVFALSTYDTDWLLVSADRLAFARAALEGEGHCFE